MDFYKLSYNFYQVILYTILKLHFITFLLCDMFLFFTGVCLHITPNIVFRTLKPILVSFTISLKHWNGKQQILWTWTLPQIFSSWSFNYKKNNFHTLINCVFGYRTWSYFHFPILDLSTNLPSIIGSSTTVSSTTIPSYALKSSC